MYAMIMARKLILERPLDDEFARHVVDDVLIPLLSYRRSKGEAAAE